MCFEFFWLGDHLLGMVLLEHGTKAHVYFYTCTRAIAIYTHSITQ